MKYLKILLINALLIGFLSFNLGQKVKAEEVDLGIEATSAIAFEASSKEQIYGKNEHQKLYPASMTKMMGMLLIMEDIEKGKYNFESMVSASEVASSMGGSQIFLEVGEQMTVEDLFKSVAIASANDAITALAEFSAGSVEAFVKRMNEKAKSLGMVNTSFANPTGFFNENHYTTAYDMGILALNLLNNYGDTVLKYTSQYESYVRTDTDKPFWLVTTNKLMRTYNGMDGLKTGYITESGYCLTATAIRNNIRIVSVVMQSASINQRSSDTKKLLDYGFSKYKSETLFEKENIIAKFDFINGKTKQTPIMAKENINFIYNSDNDLNNYSYKVIMLKTKAPIKENELVAKLVIFDKNNKELNSYNLYAQEKVAEKGFWYKVFYNWRQIIS